MMTVECNVGIFNPMGAYEVWEGSLFGAFGCL